MTTGGRSVWQAQLVPRLLALWLGMQLVIGYGVAPLLFARLGNPGLAGALAGELFRIVMLTGLPVLLGAWWVMRDVPRWKRHLLLATSVAVAAQVVALQPAMAHLKSLGPDYRDGFLIAHGASQLLYAGISLMVLTVLFAPRRRR